MTDEAEVIPIPPAPERYLYRGPIGQFEFNAWMSMHGGEPIRRGRTTVESIQVSSFQWAGEVARELVTDDDRAAMAAALRAYYRSNDRAFDLNHPSGEVEDESGAFRPGFRTALPTAEHSDGWAVTDHFMSREYPDASAAPPTVVYRDANGTAEMTRRIEVADDSRRRVLVPGDLHWVGERAGQPVTDTEGALILGRIRHVYDHWGYGYRIESD